MKLIFFLIQAKINPFPDIIGSTHMHMFAYMLSIEKSEFTAVVRMWLDLLELALLFCNCLYISRETVSLKVYQGDRLYTDFSNLKLFRRKKVGI